MQGAAIVCTSVVLRRKKKKRRYVYVNVIIDGITCSW